MKRLIHCWGLAVLFLFAANALIACSDDDPMEERTEVPVPPSDEGGGEDEGNTDNTDGDNTDGENNTSMERNIIVSVNGTSFAATLADNDAARAFAALLPLTLDMNEMNGNEKYHYLDSHMPTESYRPGAIQAGDLMLYGSSCIVLFYETFRSGYSYTRLGQIDNPEGLAAALGGGDVSVRFEVR